MDDLLRKNIFRDEDLRKLSPDYHPNDITLRMQLRRNMFRDIHYHGFLKNSNWHRKSIKRMKDGYKINKEIIKMRNDFRNSNLRNQIIMKSDLKQSISKTEFVAYDKELLLHDIKVFNDETGEPIQDPQEDVSQLVLRNDSDFKINYKQRVEKVSNDANLFTRNKNKNNITISKIRKSECLGKNENESKDDFLRIECSLAYKSPQVTERTSEDNTSPQINEDINNKQTSYGVIDTVQDLQTLLIMMAITKTNNEQESQNVTENSSCDVPKLKIGELEKQEERVISPTNVSIGHVEESLQIVPIKIEMNERRTYLSKKYFLKWQEHVGKKKEYLNKQREETLKSFLDKLSKKKNTVHSPGYINKAKLLAQDYNTYQHRYRVQKHIIALQKAKLEEQNRVIEELKYNRIVEASKESVDAMKEQVRRTYFEIDRQLKPKIKCLTNELKLNEIEEPSLVLQCLKVPRFLQRMEKRAREREEKHAMIRERRIQMEEERIRQKQQAELAKAKMDKEEKMKRIKELRDKRRKEKVETIRKKQYAARLRALIVMADLHYEKSLTAKYGIRPFRLLIQMKRDNMVKAKIHYDFQLKKNFFLNWMWYTEDMWFERNYLAEEFHRKKLLRKYFNGFKQNVRSYIIKKQVADDYYDLYITQLVFKKFREAVEMIKRENEIKWQTAVMFYNSNLTFKVFTCWRTLPALNALKREQDARKAKWRQKVLLVVPDYTPPED